MSLLRTKRYGRSLAVHEEIDSTNDDAQRAADDRAADGHVVVANAQRRGRGAHGHTWSSPAGTDLYFSIVARLDLSSEELPPITLAVGLAVAETIEAFVDTHAAVKWPNDVLVQQRKCAGILVETTTKAANRFDAHRAAWAAATAIIGVGINVNRRSWPSELASTATSMAAIRGNAFDRAVVLARMLERIEERIDTYVENGASIVVAALASRLAWCGERVRCGDVQGVLMGVNGNGALQIRTDEGDENVYAGTLVLL